MIEVSVIVPARDAAATIGATLAALQSLESTAPFEVIVVDNGSLDDTARIALESQLGPKVLRRVRGGGPGAARNEGAAVARGPVLAFTDADCEPEPQWLTAGVEAMRTAELVQGRVVPVRPPGPFDRTIRVSDEGGLYETSNLFVRRDLFERVGGFADQVDPGREAPFGEDVLFGWAARRLGVRTTFSERAVVRHAVFPRSPWGQIAERWRLRLFPDLTRNVPELRTRTYFLRYFLTRRSAGFDAALTFLAAAVALGSPLPLLGCSPYLWMVARAAAVWRRKAPAVALTGVLADCVGLLALLSGSLRARTVLL